ncbi:MAG: acyl-ACP--UDP-N-acetylglucosamine O-acyltransferase [Candidatus Omnitrophica bacterium]|nr:acyl-ACP--UDP-N-acetylglucosamine O-acyltransferase [Candidatus Omnitrophota bacterium]
MISEKAVVDKEVILGKNINVGAYAVIEKGVSLGDNVNILPFAHIKGDTCIGDNTVVGTGALIGEAPQILGCKESCGAVQIGKNNIIREYVTIHSSSSADKTTILGDNNYLMGFSHIAHDCCLDNSVVICNGALIAGHVHIYDNAFISGNVVVHQFVRIGRLAMIGGLSRVNQDVPPFMMLVGDSRVWGLNLVGLKRKGFKVSEIGEIKKAFNILYRKNLPLSKAVEELKQIPCEKVKEIVDFLALSKRGISGPHKSSFLEKIFLDYPYFIRNSIPTYDIFLKTKDRRPKTVDQKIT